MQGTTLADKKDFLKRLGEKIIEVPPEGIFVIVFALLLQKYARDNAIVAIKLHCLNRGMVVADIRLYRVV